MDQQRAQVDVAALGDAEQAWLAAGATNDLIDLDHAVIVDVEASTAARPTEVTAACTMIERAHDRLGLWPERLTADSAYGSAETLKWLVHERGIEPHILVIEGPLCAEAPRRIND